MRRPAAARTEFSSQRRDPVFDFSIASRPAYYQGFAQRYQARLSQGGATLLRLSRIKKTGHLRLHARCSAGHEFQVAAKHLEIEQWCGACRREAQVQARRAIHEELAAQARRRGYILISPVYVNARRPLRWECADGHRWVTSADNFRNKGSGCPECHLLALFEARDAAHKRRARWKGGRPKALARSKV